MTNLNDAMLVTVAQNNGIRELRNIIEGRMSTRTWYRKEKRLNRALERLSKNKPIQFIDDIEKAITLYK